VIPQRRRACGGDPGFPAQVTEPLVHHEQPHVGQRVGQRSHLQPSTAATRSSRSTLRMVVRTRDDLVDLRVAAVSQPGALLDAHWPGTPKNNVRHEVDTGSVIVCPLYAA